MPSLANRVKMTTATTGTGTITLGSALPGFQSFADGGILDGNVVFYVIEDGINWEVGSGTYTTSGTTMSRTVAESSNSDAPLNLTGAAQVYITPTLATFNELPRTNTVNTFTAAQTITDIANPLVPSLSVNAGSNITGTAITGVQITGTAGQFSCTAASLSVGQLLTISGTFGGTGSISGYANPTTYRISVTNGSTTFTLVNNTTGAALTTTAGTPTGLTYTLSSPGVNVSQTWNNTNVAFTGLRYNVTDTASNASSLLMDLQVGGVSKAAITKYGALAIRPTNTTGPTAATEWLMYRADQTATGFATLSGGLGTTSLGVYTGSTNATTALFSGGVILNSTGAYGWNSTSAATGAGYDTILTRRGAANLRLGAADVGTTTATVTITIATPGVVTWSSHGLSTGTPVFFTTTGALPTGITASTTYYVIFVTDSTFQIATSPANALAGTAVNTSGTQSGTQTGNRNAITQALSVQSVTGVTDRPGADMLITGSQGTGTGAGGSIIFRVAPAGGSSSLQNALATTAQFGPFQGKLYLGSATPTASNYALWGDATNTWVNAPTSGGYVHFGSLDNWGAAVHPTSVRLSSTFTFGWTASNPATALDTILARDAANTLALRNATNAQTFNVYNTFTDASNYERGFSRWSSNVFEIGTEKLGTGTDRGINILPAASTTGVGFLGTGRTRLAILSDGNDPVITNNGTSAVHLSIARGGTSGDYVRLNQNNPRGLMVYNNANFYVSIDFTTPTIMSTYNASDFIIQGHTRATDEARRSLIIRGGAQHTSATTNLVGGNVEIVGGAGASGSAGVANGGNILLDGGQGYGTGVTGRLVIGSTRATLTAFEGTTSSFPALKRSSTTLQVRLADDSAFAPLAAGQISSPTTNASTVITAPALGAL